VPRQVPLWDQYIFMSLVLKRLLEWSSQFYIMQIYYCVYYDVSNALVWQMFVKLILFLFAIFNTFKYLAGNLSGYPLSLTTFAHEVCLPSATVYFTCLLFIVLGNHMITEVWYFFFLSCRILC
jgi:hypothetical protein